MTATCSLMTGATPATAPVPATARAIARRVRRPGSSGPRRPRSPGRASCRRRAPRPSRPCGPVRQLPSERIVWLIVSPVVSAAAMIAVPSIEPAMISALRAGRRPTFRTPRRRNTRLRRPSTATTSRAATSPPTTMASKRCHRDAEDVAHGAGVGLDRRRCPRDRDVVGLAAGCRGVEGHELGDLLGVEARREAGLGGLLVLPEAEHERLALGRRQHVAALVAGLGPRARGAPTRGRARLPRPCASGQRRPRPASRARPSPHLQSFVVHDLPVDHAHDPIRGASDRDVVGDDQECQSALPVEVPHQLDDLLRRSRCRGRRSARRPRRSPGR